MKSLSHVRLLVTPWTAAYQAPESMGFAREEYWSGVPLPSPGSNFNEMRETSAMINRSLLYYVEYHRELVETVIDLRHLFCWYVIHFSPQLFTMVMAPHSSTLAWKIPWTEKPGRLQSWGHEESDTTERPHFHFSLSCIGEGNGNPLQCSCLENPRDGGAWWAVVYGVAQSRTRLMPLSSSSIQKRSS